MNDLLQSEALWGGVGTGLAWLVTACLLVIGAVGCVLPFLPGHLFLFLAAVSHRLMLGAEGSGLHWWSFVVLGLMMVVSQALEMLGGAAGAKWFGGSRWGALGALAGGLVGMFFIPIGLLLGPLIGAVIGEFAIARKSTRPALVSGVGSVAGTLAGMAIKLAIGGAMIGWFFLDVFLLG
jgi:uncharacterized protein YqgC (DUF456 family)